ncbi:MAG: cytochrome P450 [Deltaproteobacteria bacterium]|nr:MAG: cytochrome P450 [Deltaproteobacteria bacterium]
MSLTAPMMTSRKLRCADRLRCGRVRAMTEMTIIVIPADIQAPAIAAAHTLLRQEDRMRKVYRYGFDTPDRLEPIALLATLRAEQPVARITLPYGEDAWLVTRHESVKTVLGDPRFSRATVVAAGDRTPRAGPFNPTPNPFSVTDPPHHARLRKLVAGVFGRLAVELRRPRAEQVAGELIDDMIAVGPPVDLIQAFAIQFPTLMIGEVLGVPQPDRLQVRDWTLPVLSYWSRTKHEVDRAHRRMREYVSSLVARKREHPEADLLSTLVSHIDRQEIAEAEAIAVGVSMLLNDSTANQIGSFLYVLLTHPDQLAWLRANPSRVPDAVEELLRFAPLTPDKPGGGQGNVRMALADVELDGVCIRAGDFVVTSITSANRDERIFVDSHEIDLGRTPNPHMAFGHGPHHCPGDKLARMWLQVAVSCLLTRFSNPQLAVPADEVPWKVGTVNRGPAALQVTW